MTREPTKTDWRELFRFTVLMRKKYNRDTWIPRDLIGLDIDIMRGEKSDPDNLKHAEYMREFLSERIFCPVEINRKRIRRR